jgi:hypothetical protein
MQIRLFYQNLIRLLNFMMFQAGLRLSGDNAIDIIFKTETDEQINLERQFSIH